MRKHWVLGASGWAKHKGHPVFFIWTMPGLDSSAQRIHRQQVVDALNQNEARNGR